MRALSFLTLLVGTLGATSAFSDSCEPVRGELQLCHQRCVEHYGFTVIQGYCSYGCQSLENEFRQAYLELCRTLARQPTTAEILPLFPPAALRCQTSISGRAIDLGYLWTGCETARRLIQDNYEFPYP